MVLISIENGGWCKGHWHRVGWNGEKIDEGYNVCCRRIDHDDEA